MSSALTGNKIKDSYQALLKIGTNGSLDPTTAIAISDGLGNDTPLQLAANKLLTNYGGNDVGLKLDFGNEEYSFGDFNGVNSQSYLYFDVPNQYCNLSASPINLIVDGGNQFIKTINAGSDIGLYLNFLNNVFSFGDFSNVTNNSLINIDNNIGQIYIQSHTDAIFIGDGFYNQYNTCLVVNDNLQNIKTTFQNNDIGLYIDFNSIYCALGDYNANVNGTSFFVDDSHNTIFTQYNSNSLGLSFDFFARLLNFGDFVGYYGAQNYLQFDGNNNYAILQNGNGKLYLGDYLGSYNGTLLTINDLGQRIKTGNGAGDQGIFLDFISSVYYLGDYAGLTNNTQIVINNGLKDIMLKAENSLHFEGGGLQSASSSGNSGEHLVIYLNGTQYKIQLLNP